MRARRSLISWGAQHEIGAAPEHGLDLYVHSAALAACAPPQHAPAPLARNVRNNQGHLKTTLAPIRIKRYERDVKWLKNMWDDLHDQGCDELS